MNQASPYSIEDARKKLQKYWNYPDFRLQQRKAVSSILRGQNTMALLPTGGGKSICYQVPALLFDGLTIVISPLISLMEDQVGALRKLRIKADYIHSGQTTGNIDRILDNTIYGDTKLLYVSPERLASELFITRMKKAQVSMVAVDEAHCISQWGHDFRPSYRRIHEFLETIPPCMIMALTATATPQVVQEVIDYLNIDKSNVITDSFNRSNIAISISRTEDKVGQILEQLTAIRRKTIIYARSRRNVQMMAKTLSNHGFAAEYYHAGLSYSLKQKRQEHFKKGKIQVMVATNAFGMGIDVPDVRRVLHYDIPPSLEEYYQEIGRAGRDGQPSSANIYVSDDDQAYGQRRVEETYPEFEILEKVYKLTHVVHNIGINEGVGTTRALDLELLAKKGKMKQRAVWSALQSWQQLGMIELSYDDRDRVYIKLLLSPGEVRKQQEYLGDLYKVVESIMRSYEDAWNGWVEIDISNMAKKYKSTDEDLVIEFQKLASKGIVKTFINAAGPRLTFIQPRSKQVNLVDFKSRYIGQKERHLKRWHSMARFINANKCLSQTILSYFGEKGDRCGQCSICKPIEKEDVSALQRQINES